MIGAILCGGYGKRLKPLTDHIPKPLIELRDGYTILDKQLFDFLSANFDKVVLLTGYMSEMIEERYGSNWKGMDIEYSIEDEPLGTLNAVRIGLEGIEEPVVIRNGDVVCDVNIRRMYTEAINSDFVATVFVSRMKSPYGIVELGDNYIKSFKEKPFLSYYINGGIYVFNELLLGGFESGEIEKTVFPQLAKNRQLGFYQEDGSFWMSIDTTKDLEEVRKEYNHRKDKPWGYEKILITTEKYLTKELFIREGYQTSYHYHEEKDETLYIVKGSGHIEFEDRKEYFGVNDTLRIKPQIPHTIVGAENTILHEVSTPHPEDTVRIKDFYTR